MQADHARHARRRCALTPIDVQLDPQLFRTARLRKIKMWQHQITNTLVLWVKQIYSMAACFPLIRARAVCREGCVWNSIMESDDKPKHERSFGQVNKLWCAAASPMPASGVDELLEHGL